MLQCKLSQVSLYSCASNEQVRKYSNEQNPCNKVITMLTICRPNNPEHSHGLLGRQNTGCQSSSCKKVCDSHHENGNQIIYFLVFSLIGYTSDQNTLVNTHCAHTVESRLSTDTVLTLILNICLLVISGAETMMHQLPQSSI